MSQSMTIGRLAQTETVCETVVYTVAEQLDADPATLDPLYDVVDPDALDRLVGANMAGQNGSPVRVSFSYCGCEVEVAADGTVHVSRLDEETGKRWG